MLPVEARVVSLSAEKFEEYLSVYPRELLKRELQGDGKKFEQYFDPKMSDEVSECLMAFSVIPTGDGADSDAHYYVTINYKAMWDSKN